jgi:hypothetical protein
MNEDRVAGSVRSLAGQVEEGDAFLDAALVTGTHRSPLEIL